MPSSPGTNEVLYGKAAFAATPVWLLWTIVPLARETLGRRAARYRTRSASPRLPRALSLSKGDGPRLHSPENADPPLGVLARSSGTRRARIPIAAERTLVMQQDLRERTVRLTEIVAVLEQVEKGSYPIRAMTHLAKALRQRQENGHGSARRGRLGRVIRLGHRRDEPGGSLRLARRSSLAPRPAPLVPPQGLPRAKIERDWWDSPVPLRIMLTNVPLLHPS